MKPYKLSVTMLCDMLAARDVAVRKRVCVQCANFNLDFRDTRSEREFMISGLCQNCQDEVFDADIPATE